MPHSILTSLPAPSPPRQRLPAPSESSHAVTIQSGTDRRAWRRDSFRAPAVEGRREHHLILIDVSGSMTSRCSNRQTKLDNAVNAAAACVSVIARDAPGSRVALAAFNHKADVVCNFEPVPDQLSRLIHGLNGICGSGGTSLVAALELANELLVEVPTDATMVVNLMTDGRGDNCRSQARRLQERGVLIAIAGFGATPGDVDEGLLRDCASCVGGQVQYRFADNAADLRTTMVRHSQIGRGRV
ncbi:MAG: vWA domain-containing protein [Planctomycetota bacterium]